MTYGKAAFGAARSGGPPFPGLALSLAAVLAVAAPAKAQVDANSKAPIDITADQAEVINARCEAIWRGAAEAIQDKSRLRADTLTVYSKMKGTGANGQPSCGGADRIVADGHVYYVTPEQNARGDHAVYAQDSDNIVITGDVIVVQGQNVARGDKLTIKVSTHEAQMQSNVVGAGRPGRVRAVVYPDTTPGPGKAAGSDRPPPPEKTSEGAGAVKP